jgi:hypothetical protein
LYWRIGTRSDAKNRPTGSSSSRIAWRHRARGAGNAQRIERPCGRNRRPGTAGTAWRAGRRRSTWSVSVLPVKSSP